MKPTPKAAFEKGLQGLTEKQRRVLEAAMEVFAERGFSAASTSEIANRAGVAAGTVFKLYKTKKELLIGVLSPLLERFTTPDVVSQLESVLDAEHAHFEAFLRALVDDVMSFVSSHRKAVRIALQEIPVHPELQLLWTEVVEGRLKLRFIAAIERYQNQGELLDLPPERIGRIVLSQLSGHALAHHLLPGAPEATLDEDTEAMLQVLLRGLRPAASSA